MSAELEMFTTLIAPFRKVWRSIRVSGTAVLHEGYWISLRTRITLSTSGKTEAMFIQPTEFFAAFASTRPISELDDTLSQLEELGTLRSGTDEKSFDVVVTLPRSGVPAPSRAVHFHYPQTSFSEPHEGGFGVGESYVRLASSSNEQHFKYVSDAQLNLVSSKLRVGLPRYSGLEQLFSTLNLPFDLRQMNTTMTDVLAPLPFGISCSGSLIEVHAPSGADSGVSVVGFFDRGTAELALSCPEYPEVTEEVGMTGTIPWPDGSSEGKLFLYHDTHEVGQCSIQRWTGTRNWKVTVDKYFDSEWRLLNRHLSARNDARQFERAVTRLCNLLGAPTIWYGDKEFEDKADVCAFITQEYEWTIILGECTGQKPAAKFTPLINRKSEIEHLLNRQVRVLPTVFTPSVVSFGDRRLAAQDGIALVGRDEIVELISGVEKGWGAAELLHYLSHSITHLVDGSLDTMLDFQG